MSDKDDVISSLEVQPGTIINYTIQPAVKLVVDCGEYGALELNLPHGGRVRLSAGTRAPTLSLQDLDPLSADGENVVRIDNKK